MVLPADHVHDGAELVVWRTKNPTLEGIERDALPCRLGGSVSAGEVIVSSASTRSGTGILLAVWKTTGEVAWTQSLERAATIRADADRVYLYTRRGIVCLDALSGEEQWALAPGVPEPVSRPTIGNGHIYYWTAAPPWSSDTFLVACVDALSGALLWTSARPGCLPHPLRITDGKVLGSEHEQVFALDAVGGQVLWTHSTGSSIPRDLVAGLGGVLVRFTDGIRLLRVDEGVQLIDWAWRGRLAQHLAGGRKEAFVTRSVPTDMVMSGRRSTLAGESEIVQLRSDGSAGWTLETNPWAPGIVWDESTSRLLEVLGVGVGLIDPGTGKRAHLITTPEGDHFHKPIVESDLVYLTNLFGGEIACVRLPL
jgi:hypothetical protein